MITRIILFGCFTSCILLSAKCNNEVKTDAAKTENIVESIVTPPTDTNRTPPDPSALKIDQTYIKAKIDSLTQLIEQNPKEPDYYAQRADFKLVAGDKSGACEDYKMSKNLGSKQMQSLIDKHCK